MQDLKRMTKYTQEINKELIYIDKIIRRFGSNEELVEIKNKLSRDFETLAYRIIEQSNCSSLQCIGDIFGVTRERVRQIEYNAFKKLRHPRKRKILRKL